MRSGLIASIKSPRYRPTQGRKRKVNGRYVGKFLLEKITPRKEVFKEGKATLSHNPNKERLMTKLSYCKN